MLPVPRTQAGREALAAVRTDPAGAVIAVDYDGTLAPIAAHPQDAAPAPGAVQALTALAEQGMRVMLLTGRPAQGVVDLAGLHAVPGLQVFGQYGAQHWSGGQLTGVRPLPGVEQLRAQLPALLRQGEELEDKGISLVVHTRNASDPVGALARLEQPLRALAAEAGMEVHPGRFVLELRPPGIDKGGTLLRVAQDASAVLFAGDDVGDLPAFDAVDVLRQQGVAGVTVCSASDEGPVELRQRADLVMAGPAGVVQLLQQLAGP